MSELSCGRVSLWSALDSACDLGTLVKWISLGKIEPLQQILVRIEVKSEQQSPKLEVNPDFILAGWIIHHCILVIVWLLLLPPPPTIIQMCVRPIPTPHCPFGWDKSWPQTWDDPIAGLRVIFDVLWCQPKTDPIYLVHIAHNKRMTICYHLIPPLQTHVWQ